MQVSGTACQTNKSSTPSASKSHKTNRSPKSTRCSAQCEHSLAPDTSSAAGRGCDNMTVLIIAILGSRTEGEWYTWIVDRVERGWGYGTPGEVPRIYSESRLMMFQARRETREGGVSEESLVRYVASVGGKESKRYT